MLNSIWQARADYQEAVLAALVIFAFLRGAAPERWVAATFTLMVFVDRTYHIFLPGGITWSGIDFGHFAIDFAAVVALWSLALKANRIYPLCLAALQMAATISHVAIGLEPALLKGAYAILMIAPSYLQIVVFGAGLFLHWRRTRKFGRHRSWLHS